MQDPIPNILQIINVDPESLKPNPWNPNKVDPINQEKIENSLRQDGFFKPVLAREIEDGSLQIIGGEHRVLAAIAIGLDLVPVVNQGLISDGRAKLMGQVDNGRYGDDDAELLAALFSDTDMGSAEDIMSILPIDETDILGFVQNTEIDINLLDQLDADTGEDGFELDIPSGQAVKTSQILRFKLGSADAERITEIITKARVERKFDESDDLTNAGDALVYLLLEAGNG